MDASTVQTLQSEWQGLSPFLIASFWQVDRKGNPVNVDANGNTVAAGMGGKQIIVNAPLSESSLDVTLNWVSPFEGAGAEKSFFRLKMKAHVIGQFVQNIMRFGHAFARRVHQTCPRPLA